MAALPGSAVEIIPHLYLLPGRNRGHFPFSHSVLATGSITALIDAGCGLKALAELRDQAPPDLVIASHTHVDHTAGCWMFPRARLFAPVQCADAFGRVDRLAERFVDSAQLQAEWKGFVRSATGFRDAAPTDVYGDGHAFGFGSLVLVAIHAPGHMPDHTCLWEPDRRVLLSFDIDLSGFGPWYGSLEGDMQAFKSSIRRVMALDPLVIVSSHKGVVRDHLQARLQRFLDVFDQRDRRILELLVKPTTAADLVDHAIMYGSFPYAGSLLREWERNMLAQHLAALAADGRVVEEDGRFRRARD